MTRRSHIALSLLSLILVGNLLLLVKPVEAQIVDPVQAHIKLVLNPLAHIVARAAIDKLVKSTVTWAQNGFEGNPVYVTDPKQFFTDAANQSAGAILSDIDKGKFGFLCSPFQAQIKLSVISYYAQPGNQQLQCTWTGVTGNMQQFLDGDFSAGGWGGWFSMTQVPTNNVYGAGIAAQLQVSSQIASALDLQKTDYTKNHGFLDIPGDCLAHNPDDATMAEAFSEIDSEGKSESEVADELSGVGISIDFSKPAGACIANGPTKTPATIIESKLGESLSAKTNQLLNAHDFDEVAGALVDGLIKRIFNSNTGLFSNNPTDGWGGGEGADIAYDGPDEQGIEAAVPDTGGPTTGTLTCLATKKLATAGQTSITWVASGSLVGSNTTYTWSGDELSDLTSTSSSISLIYQTPTPSDVYKRMHLSATTADGKLVGPVLCSNQVRVDQYAPLSVSCKISGNAVTGAVGSSFTWVATIKGGSGKYSLLNWTGGQVNEPGRSDDAGRIWPDGYGTSINDNNDAVSTDPATGNITIKHFYRDGENNLYTNKVLETIMRSGDTTTVSVTRPYLHDPKTYPLGNQDAHIQVIDNDNSLPPANADCGSVYISG